MIQTLSLDRAAFASQRREAQTQYEQALKPVVRQAIEDDDWAPVILAVETLYRQAYFEETGDHDAISPPEGWAQRLEDTLEKTKGDTNATVDRIALWLSASIINVAAIQAASADEAELIMEWVTMHDDSVRATHRETDGQQRPLGEKFDVSGTPMEYPGDSRAPIALWINCRCTLRPVLAEESMVASEFKDYTPKQRKDAHTLPDGSFPIEDCQDLKNAIQAIGRAKDPAKAKAHIRRQKSRLGCDDVSLPDTWALAEEEPLDEPTHAGLAVYATDTGRVLMIQRSLDQEDEPEVQGTWEFPGGTIEEGETPQEAAEREFCEETGLPVPQGEVTNGWRSPNGVYQGFVLTVPVEGEAFDELNPDLAAAERVNPDDPQRRNPDVSAWFTIEQVQNLGPALRPEVATTDWSLFGQQEENDMEDLTAAADGQVRVPWHGNLAPEGIRSGDGRKFKEGALRHRDFPLPLTWQKVSDDGHKGNITVASIETGEVVDNLFRSEGAFLATVEANEVVDLIREFGRFGVSVDADDATFDVDVENEEVVFTDARICSACIVPIPAFAEAWVALGTWADHEAGKCACPGSDSEQKGEVKVDDELVAAVEAAGGVAEFIDIAPGKTEDGPGWLTNPVDTDRLRDYWVRGPGAAKIGWGTPGDFDRCRVNVAEYVKPQYLNGYCANRHYDALGFWPGPNAHAGENLEFTEAGEAMTLTAAVALKAPAEWFNNPEFAIGDGKVRELPDGQHGVPITVTDEGQVYGHIALWQTCHIGFGETCTTAPHSITDYAYFKTGEVSLNNGESIAVGNLTIGGGHAAPGLRAKPALAHYDSTSAVVADVNVGEDEFGIWFAGWLRAGVTDEMVTAFKASALSGDWRRIGGNLEMIAALAVNVPGFGIPRTKVAAASEGQLSLVAAGVVSPDPEEQPTRVEAERIADSLAASVAVILEERAARRSEMQALAARINKE